MAECIEGTTLYMEIGKTHAKEFDESRPTKELLLVVRGHRSKQVRIWGGGGIGEAKSAQNKPK
jgi:hypothetical protein